MDNFRRITATGSMILTAVLMCAVESVSAQSESDTCVRSTPEAILKKAVFPNRTFSLTRSSENPAERIGTEKVKISPEVELTIRNFGCESYTLAFAFLTANDKHGIGDSKYWYRRAVELMNSVKRGIRSQDVSLIDRGLKAVAAYALKTRKPRFDEALDFGGADIRDTVILQRVTRDHGRHRAEILFGVGPL